MPLLSAGMNATQLSVVEINRLLFDSRASKAELKVRFRETLALQYGIKRGRIPVSVAKALDEAAKAKAKAKGGPWFALPSFVQSALAAQKQQGQGQGDSSLDLEEQEKALSKCSAEELGLFLIDIMQGKRVVPGTARAGGSGVAGREDEEGEEDGEGEGG